MRQGYEIASTTPALEEEQTMKRTHKSICGAILVLWAATAIAAAPNKAVEMKNGKPVYDVCALILRPASLNELYETSETIVDVRVVSSEAKVVVGRFPRTFYTATVLRAFKGDLKPGQSVIFSQAAGEVELPDRILRNGDSHTLSVGEHYIVFLRLHEPYGGYVLTGDRAGAFKVINGHIEPQGDGVVADQQRNLTERQFGDEIEMISHRASPKH
jgi:hypothetical protein